MFITTAGRTDDQMIQLAKNMANELNVEYVPRKKQSVSKLQTYKHSDCIVVGKERLELFPFGEDKPFFFHPNSAMFRIKRLIHGELDPFIEASQLEAGMTVLDCTLGLASDSIVASFVVGNKGKVVGVEGNQCLAYMVKKGLEKWDSGLDEMNKAMKHIEVIHGRSYEFLKTLKEDSFDIVYFDPMFEEKILESDGIKGLSKFAIYEGLDEGTITDAIRVAKKRVVLKDHFRSSRFEEYDFQVFKRKTAKFHFGVIEKRVGKRM